MITHNDGTEQEIMVRLVVIENGTPHYHDDHDTLEDMSVAASFLTAKAMKATAIDGIERVVGFAITNVKTEEHYGDRRSVVGNLGPHSQN